MCIRDRYVPSCNHIRNILHPIVYEWGKKFILCWTMMICYIFPRILKGFATPSNDLLSCVILYWDCQNLFSTRFNIWEPVLRRNLNIQSNKFNLRYVKLDFIIWVFVWNILVNIPIIPIYLKLNLLLWILRLRLSTVSQTLNRVQKRFWQSQYRITQLSRLLLGEVNPFRIIGRM